MTTTAAPADADDHAPEPAPSHQRLSTRTAARLAWSLWALALALTALGLWLLTLTQATDIGPRWGPRGFLALFALAFTTVGALIAAHRPANRIGWLCCWIGLGNAVQLLAEEYAIYALLAAPGALPGGEVMAWLQSWIWALTAIPIWTVLPLLFPHGRLPSRRWRPVAWLAGGSIAAAAVANAFMPGRYDTFPLVRNPFGIEGAGDLLGGVWVAAVVVMVVTGVAGVVAVLRRLSRARGAERQQLKWFAYAAALVVVGWWPSNVIPTVGPLLLIGALLGMPLSVGIAILRYHLYDIDLIIRRTLLYGVLTATLALVYAGSVVLLQQVLRPLLGQGNELAIITSTLAVAALFHPLRRRLQAVIDRRFYRRRYDAAQVLAGFGARMRAETDVDQVTAAVLAVVQETIQPTHVSLWVRPPAAPRAGRDRDDGRGWSGAEQAEVVPAGASAAQPARRTAPASQ